jgi:CSLREA domain-containing protein
MVARARSTLRCLFVAAVVLALLPGSDPSLAVSLAASTAGHEETESGGSVDESRDLGLAEDGAIGAAPRPARADDRGGVRLDGAAGRIRAQAVTLSVNSTADAVDVSPGNGVCETGFGNRTCTLRAAIQEANALGGRDTIVVPAGTYRLTIARRGETFAAAGDLDLRDSVDIVGAGADRVIVDAAGIDRAFSVVSGAEVTISGLAVENGNNGFGSTVGNGGAIFNGGTLTLDRVVVRSSRSVGDVTTGFGFGGGVANGTNGRLTIRNSTLSGNSAQANGGGLSNPAGGAVSISGSVISGNVALNGGGLRTAGNNSSLTIDSTTIDGNTSSDDGGGIVSSAAGNVLTVSNSTISNNSTGSDSTDDGGGHRRRRRHGESDQRNPQWQSGRSRWRGDPGIGPRGRGCGCDGEPHQRHDDRQPGRERRWHLDQP